MSEGWQPIETAPRDGTWVLVTGYPQDDNERTEMPVVVARSFGTDGDDADLGQYWYYFWNDGYEWAGLYGPTHWMPLPD